jgi:GxxExxY protein
VDNDLTRQIIGAAMKVHSVLGPGLLESAYRTCLCHELQLQGLRVEKEAPIPIVYGGIVLDVGYRADILVERKVLVETKAVQKTLPLHEAQLLSHLRLSHHRVGLLINFNVRHLRHGITRMVN